MILDQFGREIQSRDLRRPDPREISIAQIRDRWSTYPSSGLTPRRLAAILKAADQGDVLRQAELFEEMEEKDTHLFSQFQTRKLAVQGLSWEIIPLSDSAQDKAIAQFCTEVIGKLPDFEDNVLDMLDALPKGYSMTEVMWDNSSGSAISELKWVHPKKITFWDSFTPHVLTEDEPVRGIDPAPWKFVYHRYKARSGYDTRAGIMRVCAFMYVFKNYSIKDWVAFCEVYGMPLRVGKYETGASEKDKDALMSAVRSIGTDAAGIISKSTEIEFIEAMKSGSGSGQTVYETLARFSDAQVSKAILGQTLTSEAGGEKGQGSLALGKVHGDVRQDLIQADCRALGKTITRQILRPLVGFNFGWDAPVPNFRFLYEPPEDLAAAAGVYKIVCGDLGQPVSQEHVSARFKIPLPQAGETPLNVPRLGAGVPSFAKLVAKDIGVQSQAALEASGMETLPALADEIEAFLRPLVTYVAKAKSLEEIAETIHQFYPRLDTTRFEELLSRAMFAAALQGAAAAAASDPIVAGHVSVSDMDRDQQKAVFAALSESSVHFDRTPAGQEKLGKTLSELGQRVGNKEKPLSFADGKKLNMSLSDAMSGFLKPGTKALNLDDNGIPEGGAELHQTISSVLQSLGNRLAQGGSSGNLVEAAFDLGVKVNEAAQKWWKSLAKRTEASNG